MEKYYPAKSLARVVITLLCAVLILAACTAKSSPVSENSSAASNSAFPKPGYWSAENKEPGEASGTFDLDDRGVITNFLFTATIGTPSESCEITIDRIQLEVDQAGGNFVLSYFMEYEALKEQLGAAVMSLGVIPEGKPYEVLHIEGAVSETSLTGTYTINACGPILYFQPQTGEWNPAWIQ